MRETLVADITDVTPISRVVGVMFPETSTGFESLSTDIADDGLIREMNNLVLAQIGFIQKTLIANFTARRFPTIVDLAMLFQFVVMFKFLKAHNTNTRFIIFIFL